jgi:hypothetical protein
MRRKAVVTAAAFALALGFAPLARIRAGPVTFHFAGEVTRVVDPDGLLLGAILVGDPFFGSYTFESTTPDSDPHPQRGIYDGAISMVSGQVGGLAFSGPVGPLNGIRIENDFSGPQSEIYQVLSDVNFTNRSMDFLISFSGFPVDVLSSDALSTTPPDPLLFDTAQLIITDKSETIPIHLDGEMRSLVPEPTTLVLTLAGVLSVLVPRGYRRRRGTDVRCSVRHDRGSGAPFFVIAALSLRRCPKHS